MIQSPDAPRTPRPHFHLQTSRRPPRGIVDMESHVGAVHITSSVTFGECCCLHMKSWTISPRHSPGFQRYRILLVHCAREPNTNTHDSHCHHLTHFGVSVPGVRKKKTDRGVFCALDLYNESRSALQ